MSVLDTAPASSRTYRPALARVLPALIAIALFAVLAVRVLYFELRLDEQLYIAPAALLGEHALYADVFYNHVPYSAYYYRALYLLTGGQDLILAARLGIVLAWAVTLVLVWAVCMTLARSRMVALFCVAGLATNVLLMSVPGMTATNNFLLLGPAFAALSLFVLAVLRVEGRRVFAFLAGVAMSVAVGMKVSAGVVVPVFVLAAFLMPRELPLRDRLRQVTAPMALGAVVAALPLFYHLLSDPARFLAHVLGYHTGPQVAYWEAMRATEPNLAFSLAGKVRLAYETWFGATNLLLLAGIAAILAQGMRAGRLRALPGEVMALIAAMLAVTGAMCFLPTPAFPQYFVLPLFAVILLVPLLWRAVPEESAGSMTTVLGALVALMLVVGAPRALEPVARLALGQPTTPDRVEAAGDRIRDALAARGLPGKVATLAPLYPLEAGLPVYAELSTGQFAYRVVPLSDPDLIAEYVTVGPETLGALFDAEPPAALLTGFDAPLEVPFIAWAEANGYAPDPAVRFTDRYGTATLWLPPE